MVIALGAIIGASMVATAFAIGLTAIILETHSLSRVLSGSSINAAGAKADLW
jgi:hypothetical protein